MKTRYPDIEHTFDLTFHPVDNPAPQAFTPEQIDAYNRDGYVTDVPIFEGDALADVQQFFDEHGESLRYSGPFHPFHHLHPRVYDLVCDDRQTRYVRDLVGQDVICHVSSYARKKPQAEHVVPWHQDTSFNPMSAGSVLVWFAIEDATVDNGCMWFVPGTHRMGAFDIAERDGKAAPGHVVPNAESHGEAVPIELKAGRGVVFHDLVLHYSPKNNTTGERRAFTTTYAPASIEPFANGDRWAVQACGTDSGKWNIHPRPTEFVTPDPPAPAGG